jgi:hypothetical protein
MSGAEKEKVLDMDMSQAKAEDLEVALLRALTHTQLAQITDLVRRLAEAEAQRDASADPHLLRAGLEALDRRLQDNGAIARGREATLAAQILADGAALQKLAAQRDDVAAELDLLRQTAEREATEQRLHIAALGHELQSAREASKTLQEDLDRIYASHSWKLTEPLRTARRKLGKP